MHTKLTSRLLLGALAVLTLAFFPGTTPPAAACVSCDAVTGDCVDLPVSLSGNCDCLIRFRSHFRICIPKGVCDPTNPSTCDGSGDPAPVLHEGLKFKFEERVIDRVWLQSPLLSTSLFAAYEGGFLKIGDTEGTFRRLTVQDGGHELFVSVAIGEEPDTVTVEVRLVNATTHKVHEFSGTIREQGLLGDFEERIDGALSETKIQWNARTHRARTLTREELLPAGSGAGPGL